MLKEFPRNDGITLSIGCFYIQAFLCLIHKNKTVHSRNAWQANFVVQCPRNAIYRNRAWGNRAAEKLVVLYVVTTMYILIRRDCYTI